MKISSAKNTGGNVSQGGTVVNVTFTFKDTIGAIAATSLAAVVLVGTFRLAKDVFLEPCSCRNDSAPTNVDWEDSHGSELSQDSAVSPAIGLWPSDPSRQYTAQEKSLVQDFINAVNGIPQTRTLIGPVSHPSEVTSLTELSNSPSLLDPDILSISLEGALASHLEQPSHILLIPSFANNEYDLSETKPLLVQQSNTFDIASINSLEQEISSGSFGLESPMTFNFERQPSFEEEQTTLQTENPVADQSPEKQPPSFHFEDVSQLPMTQRPNAVDRPNSKMTSPLKGDPKEIPSVPPIISKESTEEASKIPEHRGVIGSTLAAIIGLLVVSERKKGK